MKNKLVVNLIPKNQIAKKQQQLNSYHEFGKRKAK